MSNWQKWFIFALIFISFLFGILSLILKNKTSQTELLKVISKYELSDKTAPDEIGISFDPTINVGSYAFLDTGATYGTLKLKRVWPLEGELADETKITCDGGIVYRKRDDKIEEYIDTNTMWETITSIKEKKYLVLNALCKDSLCTEMIGECKIYNGGGE
jgi:hypothetical protein